MIILITNNSERCLLPENISDGRRRRERCPLCVNDHFIFLFFADVSAKRNVAWIDFRLCVDT